MKRFLLYLAPPLLLLWGQSAVYTVDQAEFVYQTRFGEPIAMHDGATEAGLHVKLPWPVESVQRIDRRLQVFDLPPTESLTRDPLGRTIDKTLAVDATVCWRIPDAESADRFVRTVGTAEQAKRLLAPRVSGRLAAVVSNMPLDDLIAVADMGTFAGSAASGVVVALDGTIRAANLRLLDERSERVRRRLLGLDPVSPGEEVGENLPTLVLAEYGIEIVDVRVRRFNYPEAVRASIAERIRSERARKVADYESEGRRRAADIASNAEREARKIESDARALKQRVEGRADADADAIRNEAHARDREFYTFLQKLKSYQAMLADTRDVLLLSTKHPLFDVFRGPPMPNPKP